MRLLVVSHSYLDSLNARSLEALGEHIDVTAVVPFRGNVLVFSSVVFKCDTNSCINWRRSNTISFREGQILYLSLIREMRITRPEIVLVEYNPWSLPFLSAALARYVFLRRTLLVVNMKKNTYNSFGLFRRLLKKPIARWALAHTDLVLANSRAVVSAMQDNLSIASNKIAIVPHIGVDVVAFRPEKHHVKSQLVHVGYCGRLARDKGVWQLVQAVARARARTNIDIALTLVGSGSLFSSLSRAAAVRPWLTVAPSVRHGAVPSFLNSLDIYVLAAQPEVDHEEHDAQGLIEAMACGLPCIGTDCGVIPEVLADGAGVVVPPFEHEALVDAIVWLAMDLQTRSQLGAIARKRVIRRYSAQAVASRKARLLVDVWEGAQQDSKGELG